MNQQVEIFVVESLFMLIHMQPHEMIEQINLLSLSASDCFIFRTHVDRREIQPLRADETKYRKYAQVSSSNLNVVNISTSTVDTEREEWREDIVC